MTTLDQKLLESDIIVFEGESQYSRETITVASGAGVLARGAVLGKITASGKYILSAPAASDGSQTPVAVLIEPVDATSADVDATALLRFAVVNRSNLSYAATIDTAAERQTAVNALQAVGILAREGA